MWCGGFYFVWWFWGKVVVSDGWFVSCGPLLCPLSLAAPGTYYAIGPMAAFAFETTFTSLQRCRTVLSLAFVLSCIGDRCIVDGLLAAPRTVGKFHFSCTGFPRVNSSTAAFTNVDSALAFVFVCVVA